MAHFLDIVLRGDLAAEERDASPAGRVVGQGQLEGVVAFIIQFAAKTGDGGLGYAAGLCQL